MTAPTDGVDAAAALQRLIIGFRASRPVHVAALVEGAPAPPTARPPVA